MGGINNIFTEHYVSGSYISYSPELLSLLERQKNIIFGYEKEEKIQTPNINTYSSHMNMQGDIHYTPELLEDMEKKREAIFKSHYQQINNSLPRANK